MNFPTTWTKKTKQIRNLLATMLISSFFAAALPSQANCSYFNVAEAKLVLTASGTVACPGGQGEVLLKEGKLLVNSRVPLKISTSLADIYVRDNAVVIAELQDGCLSVTTLFDSHRKSVQVVVAKHLINTGVGERLMVSKGLPEVQEVFEDGALGLRRLTSEELESGTWITSAEFSLVDALKHEDVLAYIRSFGPKVPEAALLRGITKTAAALETVTADREEYVHLKRRGEQEAIAHGGTGM